LRLKIYIGIITASAIALFIYLIPSLPPLSNIWLAFIFFLAISAFAEFIPVNLPMGGGMSIGFPIDFVLILVYGPALAMLITALGALIAEIIERKISWYKILFNTFQFALSTGVAGLVYQYTGGIIGFQNFLKFILPAALCALVYCFSNLTLITIAISLDQESRIATVWRVNFKENLSTYIAEAPMGFLMAIVYVEVGIIGILLFFLPLLLARRSFELYTKMRKVYLDTIRALAAAIDAKDPYTKGHSERVAEMSVALAQELNLSGRDIENIEYTALLHDIGKIGIADNILGKNSSLTDKEFDKIKEHTIMGAKIIEPVDFLKNSYKAIYHHHEKYNGKGYPDGLKSEDIPLSARIIAVADTYDAMGSDRPYRKKLHKDKILKELKDQSGKQFDPEVVKAFISVLKRKREE
ncbi:MAG: HD-GYP domain-containing protein, partial [Candidatus Caldatribacteriota bacterium]|nr:HD-GYP domain-containing protein [Candidatus Caldatribacteriota bacterium]